MIEKRAEDLKELDGDFTIFYYGFPPVTLHSGKQLVAWLDATQHVLEFHSLQHGDQKFTFLWADPDGLEWRLRAKAARA